MSNGVTTTIKFEVPSSQNCHVAPQIRLFEKVFSKYYTINKKNEQDVQEAECEPFTEIIFEIFAKIGLNFRILEAISEFYAENRQNSEIEPEFRGTVILHSPLLFRSEIVCFINSIPLNSIHFGNIFKNVHYSHWEVGNLVSIAQQWPIFFLQISFNTFEDHRHREKYATERTLEANFEFDSPNPLVVNFKIDQDTERIINGNRKIETNIVNYKLSVFRYDIRRIICELDYRNGPIIHFELNVPVCVKRAVETLNRSKKSTKSPKFDRVLTIKHGDSAHFECHPLAITDSPFFSIIFNQIDTPLLYKILSRFRHRCDVPIEFFQTDFVYYPYSQTKCPYNNWVQHRNLTPTHFEEPLFAKFLSKTFVEGFGGPRFSKGHDRDKDKIRAKKFAYVYLIECLLSRGAVVKDQLLIERNEFEQFLKIISGHFNDDEKHELCESALEDLVNMIDCRKRIGKLHQVFEQLCRNRLRNGVSNEITLEMYDDGYRRVRKVVLTPTRKILVVPETIMSNRVLHRVDHDCTRVLRVVFRDDDNQNMRLTALGGLLRSTMLSYLQDGIHVAGREFGYLGSSNSQMRNNGAYFMEKYSARNLREYRLAKGRDPSPGYRPKIETFRKSLGKFEEAGSISKAMARLGQCFTQTRVCKGHPLERSDYMVTFDVVGGRAADTTGSYTFTDGIGAVSASVAKKVAKLLKLGKGCVPSAYQIRFRGMKGMIAIDPQIDTDVLDVFVKDDVDDVAIVPREFGFSCVFRPSQIKFISARTHDNKYDLEIVKFSMPTPVALNRPFINILDQVSSKQSFECHRRVCERVRQYLDIQLESFAKLMINEDACRGKLEEMPRRIRFASLLKRNGFVLSTEPFFRTLIRASIDFVLAKLVRKSQIQVPTDLGRSMFGVTDETGRLQYGQVFVQYTKNVKNKTPTKNDKKIVLNGRVMITKCPSVVSGDVRMFEAVDIPELHHMCDVVVFPQHGPRPHPDEMAGSDLDGDEYSVIWDSELFFDGNEKAFDFVSTKNNAEFKIEEMDKLMHEFYVHFMEQDSIGMVASNHLHLSDHYGIDSKVCMNLATKLTQALDFAKSGTAPDPLTRKWQFDAENLVAIPPEVAERQPDFSAPQERAVSRPIYYSTSLLGSIFRELMSIDDVMKLANNRRIQVVADEMLDYFGWEMFEDEARREMAKYNSQMRSIMENYGIRTEAEVFSGFILDMRNRISDKEQDDMSFFNTENVIETKITELFRKFRENFFNAFAGHEMGYMRLTEPEGRYRSNDETDVLRRVCRMATDEMKRKAVAYYKVTYEEARKSVEQKLSFAWIAYDILNSVREWNILERNDPDGPSFYSGSNPLYEMIERHRFEYCDENRQQFQEFLMKFKNLMRIRDKVGLDRILFIINNWAISAQLISTIMSDTDAENVKLNRQIAMNRIKDYHILLIFIMFAAKQIGPPVELDAFSKPVILPYNVISLLSGPDEVVPSAANRLTIEFFRYLASRHFRSIKYLTFRQFGLNSIFMRGEWTQLHQSAVKTFYNLLLNVRFEELPLNSDVDVTSATIIRECPPFTMDLPAKAAISGLATKLESVTGCVEIQYRKIAEKNDIATYRISARGTIESLQKLRKYVAVPISRKSSNFGETLGNELATIALLRIKS
ncbi:unnamed protein product [Caenorhabditis bovis]|uniref:RNA-directed RNA polymerase n=1 Tax=Caenorhabditis bovis TaxID=2654633 RepID=A0A8S1F4V6_9PELO|nr:unnamed protein product [Caenorhabditis bovis]